VPTFNATSSGGLLRGSNQDDTINGASANDVLFGLGGNDAIFGGAGDDIINGDGAFTVADQVRLAGSAGISNAGVTGSTAQPLLTAMGMANGQSIWRIRNLSDSAMTVVLQSASNGKDAFTVTLVVPAHTDYFATSTNLSTHKLYFGDKQVDVKGINTGAFAYEAAFGATVEGNDTLDGGAGNDTLNGNGGNDKLYGGEGTDALNGGAGNDLLAGGKGADKLVGGDGVDTADYSASSASVTVNLEAGVGLGGDAEGDTLQGVENLIGSNFNDVLTGNALTNLIEGGAGNDVITGGHNNDKLYGGAGDDLFLVEWSYTGDLYDGGEGVDTFSADVATLDAYAQEIDLATGTNNWQDTFVNIENLIGGANNDKLSGTDGVNSFWGRGGNDVLDGRGGDDKLYGEAGDDTVKGGDGNDLVDGGAGNDLLAGGLGADTLVGGDGSDTADYAASSAGVTVNLVMGTAGGGDAAGDTLSGIENIVGSKYDDVLVGDAGVNVLDGGAGNDVLAGGDGADKLIGGDGIDAADYSNNSAGVQVNLASGANSDNDSLLGIENLHGSKFNDVLAGDAGVNVLDGGAGNDVLAGGAGADQIIGGDGNDTADYSSSGQAVQANLLDGQASDGDKFDSIENLTGSKFDDVLTGDKNGNILDGGAGNDWLVGGDGADLLVGGDGIDTADYSAAAQGVEVSLSGGVSSEGDKLLGIENLIGSAFDDALRGNDDINVIKAGNGNDRIYGSLGADVMDGGNGTDTADYGDSGAAVNASLLTNSATGGEAEGDTFINIENLTGSNFDDILIGNDGVNRLVGNQGADKLYGGAGNDWFDTGGGYDFVDGGAGIDTVTYDDSWGAVVVNLALGTGSGAEAANDSYINIESIVGSLFGDTLTGDANVNRLTGLDGNDVLNGGAGNDYLVGGLGADTLIGGAGDQDVADYDDAASGVVVNLVTGGTGGEAAGDTYAGVEYVYGSQFDDQVTGDGAVNRLIGNGGNDVLDGGAGNDILIGGAGADKLIGGAGDQDAASYQDAAVGVIVNLALGGTGGDAAGDTYNGVEYVYGSAFNDTIVGDVAINRLVGGAGNDLLDGAGGNDYLLGEAGNDTLTGGAGADVYIFALGFGNDTITDFWTGVGRTDRAWFQGVGLNSYADVLANAVDTAAGVVISAGAQGVLTLSGVTLAQLNADDFLFN
jgi:Ca2+-binding RTX toxin-like protein